MSDIKECLMCKHSLENNMHGFDQNDAYLDENGKLVHSGRCTYCKICRSQGEETNNE